MRYSTELTLSPSCALTQISIVALLVSDGLADELSVETWQCIGADHEELTGLWYHNLALFTLLQQE